MLMFDNKLFVKLGYGDDYGLGLRSLHFRTDEMDANEACEVVKVVKGYNRFNGEELAKVIKEIAKLWPSSHQQVSFSFGREGSPVLYTHFPYWKSTAERFEDREELIKKSLALLKICEPDELDEDCVGFQFRAWWD